MHGCWKKKEIFFPRNLKRFYLPASGETPNEDSKNGVDNNEEDDGENASADAKEDKEVVMPDMEALEPTGPAAAAASTAAAAGSNG